MHAWVCVCVCVGLGLRVDFRAWSEALVFAECLHNQSLKERVVESSSNQGCISTLGGGHWKTWNTVTLFMVCNMSQPTCVQVLGPHLLPVSLWERP